MASVRPFEGDAAEAAHFSIECWRRSYAQISFYPLWNADYMAWQLFDVPAPERVLRLGAYEEDRLVGFFAAEEMEFRGPEGPVTGTMSSWLSVDHERPRAGIGGALRREMWDWHRRRGSAFMIGFVNSGTVKGKGRDFWRTQIPNAEIRRRPRIWGHVFNPAAAAAAEFTAWEAAGVRLLTWLQRGGRSCGESSIRPYADPDFLACRAIFDEAARRADFGYDWDDARLAHQLSFRNMPRTLLLNRGGSVEGLFNYYALHMVGRSPLRCAVVDFILVRDGVEGRTVRRFVRLCLAKLEESGFDVALTLGPPVHRAPMLIGGGFLPLPRMQSLIYLPVDPSRSLPRADSMLLHWR